MTPKQSRFLCELNALLQSHRLHLAGNMRLIDMAEDKWDSTTLAIYPDAYHGGVRDTTGPFLTGSVQEKPPAPVEIPRDRIIHVSPDIQAYDCPITGKLIDGRREHRENLKRTGCRNLEPGESRESQSRREREITEHCSRAAREMVMTAARQLDL